MRERQRRVRVEITGEAVSLGFSQKCKLYIEEGTEMKIKNVGALFL